MDTNLIYLIVFIVIALTAIGLGVGLGIGLSGEDDADDDNDGIPNYIDTNGIFIRKRIGSKKVGNKYKLSIYAGEYVKTEPAYNIYTSSYLLRNGIFYPRRTTWKTSGGYWPGPTYLSQPAELFSPYLVMFRGGIKIKNNDEENEEDFYNNTCIGSMLFQFNPKINLETLKEIHDNYENDKCIELDDLIKDIDLGLDEEDDVVINWIPSIDINILGEKN